MTRDIRIQQRKPQAEDRLPGKLHPVLRRVLLARGIGSEEELDLQLGRLARPSGLHGLAEAAEILADAVCADEHIRIVGDFDADGATGTAVAIRGLRAMGATNVDFRVPNRFEFGYGLTPGLVDSFSSRVPALVVTVDSGIACLAGTARARELGCRVIVTDHHLPGPQLPDAHAIVNPNQAGDEFPSKALSGVGVMFYLLSGLRKTLQERGWFGSTRRAPRLDSLLDLVALGTVADLVPLDLNNRILVRQGMDRIRAERGCPGIMALLRAGKRDYRHLVASDLGFAVAPRLNAAGRLEDMSVGIRCLLSDDPDEAWELAVRLDKLNHERRSLQAEMQEQALEMVNQVEVEESAGEDAFSLCLYDESWHQGIVGLVASRLKDRVHRPVIAFAPEESGSSSLKGSARSIPGLHIRDVLAFVDANNPGLITAFGGHAMAAGLSLGVDKLETFQSQLEDSVRTFLDNNLPSATIETDGELEGPMIELDFASSLRALGPWGQRFPEPLFEGAFEILNQRVVGGAHLKMVLRPLDGHAPVDAIAFGTLPEDLPGGHAVRILYRLDVNHFRGDRICQLVVERIVS